MKRLFAYILVLVLLLALIGCNSTQNNQDETLENTTSHTSTASTEFDNTPEETSTEEITTPEETSTEETTPEEVTQPPIVYPVSVTYHSMVKDFVLGELEDLTKEVNLEIIVSFTYSELDERINTMNSTRAYLPGRGAMPGYNMNENNVFKVLESLYSIEYIACRSVGLTSDTMKAFGLDKDVYYLTYATFTGNMDEDGNELYAQNELFISQKTKQGTYYVASTFADMIVEVDQSYLFFLEWNDMKWYDDSFMLHNLSYVRDINFEFNGEAFGFFEDKTYDFELDNSLSYAYYVNEKNEFKAVDWHNGKVYVEGNKKIYKVNNSGKSYDIVAELNLDEVEVVGHKQIILDPTLYNVVYVPEIYYYVNSAGEHVEVFPDYITKTIELKNAQYHYVDVVSGESISVYRSFGDPVYRYTYQGNMYEATVSPNTMGLRVSCNGNLLDYTIPNVGLHEDDAADNFRKLYMQLLTFSLLGEVDPVEFEAAMGMSVEEYLASDAKKPMATISMHIEDYARALNGYTIRNEDGEEVRFYQENNSQHLVYKFYQYSDCKVLVTIEVLTENENGELISTVTDENGDPIVVGKFYASIDTLDKLADDIDRLLNAELIEIN